jgi:putative thiazole-containing bacteriocin maturation protein
MQPKLNADTFYIPTADGVYFRNHHGSLKIKGTSIYRWVESLVPYLDGTHSLTDLIQGLDTQKQAMVTRLLETLLTHQFLRDTSADLPHTLSQSELETYAAELAFIESFQDSPAARFERFRRMRVVAIGSGLTLTALVHAMLKGGLRHLTLLITDECETARSRHQEYLDRFGQRDPQQTLQELDPLSWADERQVQTAIEPFEMIIHISDRPMLARAQQLTRLCFAQQKPLLQAVVVKDEAWIGPLVCPPASGCWECAWRRLLSNLNDLRTSLASYAFADHPEASSSPFLAFTTAALIANMVSFEAFKYATEAGPLETPQHLIELDLQTLTRQRHAFLPHPLCQACQQPFAPGEEHFLETMRQLEQAEPLDPDLFSRRAAPCIERRLGLIQALDEDDFEQLPLNMCQALVSNPLLLESPAPFFQTIGTGIGFALTRRRTMQQALELYASCLVDTRRLPAFEERPDASLTLARDLFPPGEPAEPETGWSWAVDLHSQQATLVPASLVYPALLGCAPTPQQRRGVASGMSWAEAVCRALLALCADLTVADIARATTPFPQVDLASVELDPQTSRQRSALSALKEIVEVYDVTGPLQVPTFALCVQGRTVTYSTHLDVALALREGLEAVLGQRQAFSQRQDPVLTSQEGFAAVQEHLALAFPAVPELPRALRGERVCVPHTVGREDWPSRQRWLQQRLHQQGWKALAVPLNHDPACTHILPFLVRVLLAHL